MTLLYDRRAFFFLIVLSTTILNVRFDIYCNENELNTLEGILLYILVSVGLKVLH